MDFYEERQRLQSITTSVRTSRDAIDVDKLKQELQALEAKRADESFWQDVEHAKSVNMRVAQIERSVEKVELLEKKCLDLSELIDMAEGENDPELENEITELTKTLEQESEQLFLESLLRGKYDSLNAILTIHAGAGGKKRLRHGNHRSSGRRRSRNKKRHLYDKGRQRLRLFKSRKRRAPSGADQPFRRGKAAAYKFCFGGSHAGNNRR